MPSRPGGFEDRRRVGSYRRRSVFSQNELRGKKRKDKIDEVINILPAGWASWRQWKDGGRKRMCLCSSVCPNSKGAPPLSPSRWAVQCCAPWAEGTSWSNAGPSRSNGNTSVPCCRMWASPCAPAASRYCIYISSAAALDKMVLTGWHRFSI